MMDLDKDWNPPEPKDGGPAFPRTREGSGMSLRDWFAGIALQGMAGNPAFLVAAREEAKEEPVTDTVRICAQGAYEFADAMIAERKKDSST